LPFRVAGRLLDAAFPAVCVGCAAEGAPLCTGCLPALAARRGTPPGVPLGLPSTVPLPLLQLEWCAPYAGAVRSALHALKYAGERRLAVPLGTAIAARWAEAGAGGELLVPVPIHAERRRRRGYDQAVLLAEAAAASLGLPTVGALARARPTRPQFELGRERRAENVADAFRVLDAQGAVVAGRWIVLVDDVATTGATLGSAAQVLKQAGAAEVMGLVVIAAQGRGGRRHPARTRHTAGA
jgi:ComF family protein